MKHIAEQYKAILSSKSQVVIPVQLRVKMGLQTGHEILFSSLDDHTLALHQAPRHIGMMFERCEQPDSASMSIEAMEQATQVATFDKRFYTEHKDAYEPSDAL